MGVKPSYKKIVVGIDFSDASLLALAHAMALAEKCDARVELVHVVEDTKPPPWSSESLALAQRLRKHDTAEAKAAISALVRRQPAKVAVRGHVLAGAAYIQLPSFAKRAKADLLVLANTGRTRPVDVAVGSTAQRTLSRCAVPLMLVPAPRPDRARKARAAKRG